ncbi:signal recognition particle-docking protein FtsY [Shewanella salipaludis]|uniref:Signal recognition particle receptor FtsY n=1 Tax=Shewanella salipaludis TaxID=2723052 RepID=A0A972JIH9_9GAMM|nr:signal recognition particle-docking protein FtsY [Shewanella salipaludis]NMH65048.1 signal recognition particle-docking protein FtsY [Shewanella salipaludis]
MAKKGFFSWFRKDKSPEKTQAETEVLIQEQDEPAPAAPSQEQHTAEPAVTDTQAQAQAAAIQAEQAQAAAAEAELQARLLAERQAAEAAAAAQLESENQARLVIEAEKRAEAEQLARLAAQQEAQAAAEERARLAAQAAEQEAARAEAELQARLAAQQAAEAAAEERARLAAQAAEQEAARAEAELQARLAAQQATEAAAEQRASLAAQAAEQEAAQAAEPETQEALQPEPQAKPAREGLFARLRRGLRRTSENIGSGFMGLFRGKKIDDELFEELEEQLLIADVGVETTTRLINSLTEQASRKQLQDAEALYELLRDEMQKTLEPVAIPLVPENADGPFVILMVGVNGVGKTTTIGKLAKQYQSQGKSVLLAAGDTFRAAAVEQLQVWGQRNDISVIAQHTGADSASVLFDALQAAKARKIDVLIADTAGRLQNKSHLMEELKKVVRVMKKLDPNTPHEVMLTLDASTGQNAISQAQLFQEAVGVTGITVSKLDGTAKGGVIFAIADKFGIPIRYIGVGEQIDDLRTFDAGDFIEALFSQEKSDS